MKTIKVLFFICCILLVFNTTAQQQVSIEEAKIAATQTLNMRQGKEFAYDEIGIERINTLKNEKEDVLIYEVIFNDNEGILLSGSKACLPILGYFTCGENQSVFDDDAPDGLKFMLEEYKGQVDLCFQNDTIQLYCQDKWRTLLQKEGVLEATTGNIIVQPLLTSRWGQRIPNNGTQSNPEQCNAYNYYAPIKNCDTCKTKCLAGCVAVAMAQIMYYWKYPVYYYPLDFSFRFYQYDWCSMVDALNTNLPNYINARNAIARLIKDCGDAVGMDFGCTGSTASMSNAQNAFVGSFGYHGDADYQLRALHNDSKWKNRIKDDLNLGRPVLYGGKSSVIAPKDAHTFVCDGYRDDDFFHFNFGWIGGNDGWFTIDDLTPGDNNYNTLQEAVFFIRPNNDQHYCNFNLSLYDDYAHKLQILLIYAYWGFPITQEIVDIVMASAPPTVTILTIDPSTIESGSTVIYTAHREIRFLPGFHAEAGSYLHAYIKPCPSCNKINNPSILAVFTDEELKETSNFNDDAMPMNTKFVQAEANGKEIILYPNPNNGTFRINANFPLTNIVDFKIINLMGTPIYETSKLVSNTVQIETSTSGHFFVIMVLNDGSVLTQKMVIQR